MINNKEEYILISDQSKLDDLIDRFITKQLFAHQFKFSERDFFITLLESLDINYEDFTEKYYHYDGNRNLHISESGFGYVWISTFGLIAKNKSTTSNSVNSCVNQYTVISLLLKKAIKISQSETVYDVDSYNFGYLSELSSALFHNSLFYIEVLCKAYLSLNGIQSPHTHKLSVIYQKTLETMVAKNHTNSLFHVQILNPLYKFIEHINRIPGNFKEQFIKYDDNPQDDTVIIFRPESLAETMIIFELSIDFILDFFHTGTETHYLKSGLYQRLLDKAETDDEKKKIHDMYGYLVQDT